MGARFAIYSTDATDVANPDTASFKAIFTDVPWEAGVDAFGGGGGRGSVVQTLGGAVIQDFGVWDCDKTISFSAQDALRADSVAALETASRVKDARYFFTDGYNVYRVAFSRNPAGFKSYRNYKYSERATAWFSYEINLIVIEKVI